MKLFAFALAVLALSGSVGPALGDQVEIGDSAARVREILGPPEGYIKSGNYELLMYDRGRIEVREGVVTKCSLMTPEEAAEARAEKERLRQARVEAELKRREQLRAQGERVRDTMLADPVFLAQSAGDQLAYWRTFKKSYPGVEIDADYQADLIAGHTRDLRNAETEQRLREMEHRVAAAEARAERAERDASEARRRSRSYLDYGYPVVRYGTPVVVSQGPSCYRTPTVRTPTVRKSTTTVGPCTGRSILTQTTPYSRRSVLDQNKPYTYTPSYSWLGRGGSASFSGTHKETQVRAKVSF